jgi:TRAP-type C4-dicarboxylate transport system substrate-binding protein
MSKQTIKWLLFHEPAELFIRTAKEFNEEVNKLTGDKYNIEILKLEDYNDKYNNGKPCDPLAELKSGRVHMSQMYTGTLAYSSVTDFYALSLPFLFTSHDHATRVFEGEIGKDLMTHLHNRLKLKGLSFTYSGGYKVMATDTPIRCVEDLSKVTYKAKTNAIFSEMMETAGATPTETDADLTSTTLPRYKVEADKDQKYVSNTGHSMYLTSILVNDETWNDLSAEDQAHFMTAAKICARTERAKSVADGEEIRTDANKQKSLGIEEMIEFDQSEINKLKALWTPIQGKWEKYFTNGLVDRIRKA